jgi:hypothetical protein
MNAPIAQLKKHPFRHVMLGVFWLIFLLWTLAGSVRPHITVGKAPRSGPMAVEGKVHSSVSKFAPSGRPAAAWFTAMASPPDDQWKEYLLRWINGDCQADANQLELTDGTSRLAVSPELFRVNRELGWTEIPYASWSAEDAPSAVAAGCQNIRKRIEAEYYPQNHRMIEVSISEGDSLVVSGCRKGNMLVPCGDALDGISDHFNAESIRFASGFLQIWCVPYDLEIGCSNIEWRLLPIAKRRFDVANLLAVLFVAPAPWFVLIGTRFLARRLPPAWHRPIKANPYIACRNCLLWLLIAVALSPFVLLLFELALGWLGVEMSSFSVRGKLLHWASFLSLVLALLGTPALTVVIATFPAEHRPGPWKIGIALSIAWLAWLLVAAILLFFLAFGGLSELLVNSPGPG